MFAYFFSQKCVYRQCIFANKKLLSKHGTPNDQDGDLDPDSDFVLFPPIIQMQGTAPGSPPQPTTTDTQQQHHSDTRLSIDLTEDTMNMENVWVVDTAHADAVSVEIVNQVSSGGDKRQRKPYKCKQCKQGFSRYSSAKKHCLIFTWVCPTCGTKISHQPNVGRHILRCDASKERMRVNVVQSDMPIQEPSLEGRTCPVCNKVLKNPATLKTHTYTFHQRSDGDFKCNFCDFRCSRVGHLKKHVTIKHKEEVNSVEFKCSKCDFSCSSKNGLGRHVRLVHLLSQTQLPSASGELTLPADGTQACSGTKRHTTTQLHPTYDTQPHPGLDTPPNASCDTQPLVCHDALPNYGNDTQPRDGHDTPPYASFDTQPPLCHYTQPPCDEHDTLPQDSTETRPSASYDTLPLHGSDTQRAELGVIPDGSSDSFGSIRHLVCLSLSVDAEDSNYNYVAMDSGGNNLTYTVL